MKKFVVTILALIYLGTSTGATIHMHYCMGKLASWGLGHNESKTCGECGMEKTDKKDNGCCKDEHQFFKNTTDQKTVEASLQLMQIVATSLPVSFIEIPAIGFTSVTEENPLTNAPPRSYTVAVYIRNCVFLI